MTMWTQFRALAARIGLSREEVEAVERGGVPTYVRLPLFDGAEVRVRPDADWTQRMSDAWQGELMNSRQQSAGTIPIPDGRLLVADEISPEQGLVVDLVAGEYEVVLTIAHVGNEESGDYDENVSHAWALWCGDVGTVSIAPLTDDDGVELGVDAASMIFAGTGVVERLAAKHSPDRLWAWYDIVSPARYAADPAGGKWGRVATEDGTGALIAVSAGHGREDYPVFRIADADGRTVGVLLDFFVDNRTD